MKKVILPLLAFLCLSLNALAQGGPCTVHGFTLRYLSATQTPGNPGKVDIRVDLSWDIAINSGNKFSYFHIWEAGSYVTLDYTKTSKPPVAADLSTSLGTIVIKDPSTNPVIVNTYSPDNSYTKLLATVAGNGTLKREVINGTTEQFTVSNLLIPGVTPSATGSYSFRSDIWSSQQSTGGNIHCALQDKPFVVNNVVDRSLFRCNNGGLVNVRLASSEPSATGTYQLYVDNTTPGTLDEASDLKIGTPQSFTTGSTAGLNVNYPYEFSASDVTIPNMYNGKTIWLVVTPTGKSNQLFPILNTCSPLPVTFANFSVAKNKQSVAVKWQTSYEQNVAGFNVQRITNGGWTTVAFVPAANIASGSAYQITDQNTFQGLSQYRIVSVDIDGKQKMSEVRSIRGDAMSTKLTMYPNPSTTGRVHLVFDNNADRDIRVMDMSGRVVKQLTGEKGSNVILDITQDGFYQIHIADRNTGESMVEKIIIKKR